MIRTVASRVLWAGRTTVFMMGLALVLALVFGMASTAFGANGANFILGSLNNTATAITKLTGTVGGGPALQVSNPSTTTGATALDLRVATGKAPMKVNSQTKVTNLNSDKVDGLEGASFVQGGGRASQGIETITSGASETVLTTSNPNITLRYQCNSSVIAGDAIVVTNSGSELLRLYTDNNSSGGFEEIRTFELAPNGFQSLSVVREPTHYTFQAQGTNLATIEVFSHHNDTVCRAQAQALVTR